MKFLIHIILTLHSILFLKSFSTSCIHTVYIYIYGPGSSVGIATELGAGRSRIESRRGRDFPPVQTNPEAHPASCTVGTGSFPGVKCGRDVLLTTHPLLVPRSWNSRAIPLYPPSGPHRACNGIALPYMCVCVCIYIYLFIYNLCKAEIPSNNCM